jgi:hypothetical protein
MTQGTLYRNWQAEISAKQRDLLSEKMFNVIIGYEI